jgi:hypothetical protein
VKYAPFRHTVFVKVSGQGMYHFDSAAALECWSLPPWPADPFFQNVYLLPGGRWVREDELPNDEWSIGEIISDIDAAFLFHHLAPAKMPPELARVFAGRDLAIAKIPAGQLSPAPPPVASPSKLVLVPGGLLVRGHTVTLAGRPWSVLNALLGARDHTLSLVQLLHQVWEEPIDTLTVAAGSGKVRTQVGKARAAVRRVYKAAGLADIADPIPCLDQGPNLAWKLLLPDDGELTED